MSIFNPLNYDVYCLGLSGGKDSTAVYLWAKYESDWPQDRLVVTFNDTGNEDYYTYAFLDILAKYHPIETIKPEMNFWELAKFKKRFPSRRARFCTQWLKIIPSREYVLDLQRQGKNVLLVNGVRKEEGRASNDRGNLSVFGWDDGYACDIYRPVYHWSIDDVWAIHKRYLNLEDVLAIVIADPYLDEASKQWSEMYHVKVDFKEDLINFIKSHGIPRNPLYDLGASRVGCFPCINSAKSEVRAMAKYRPQRVEFLAEKEAQTGMVSNVGYSSFFARKTVPESHRSKEIVTTMGEKMRVATIHDVVEWSKTARGGKQFDMDLEEPPLACGIHGECE